MFVLLTLTTFCLAETKVEGKMKLWYSVILTYDGPEASEESDTFRNYRLNVTFSKGGRSLVVPGYFAADGDAANSSATSGNKWRVKFTPDATGRWQYKVSFRVGKDVAASLDPLAGEPGSLDGVTGEFTIGSRDPQAPGFYSKGKLRYVGEHYLQFAGSGEWFVKAGPGSPEDFLGYADFDGTFDRGGSQNDDSLGEDGLHNYDAHVQDWRPWDPTWKGGKGKGIIGALNYIASTGCNTIYNVILTINGDADTTWPWTEPIPYAKNEGPDYPYNKTKFKNLDVYDVSKLEQWDIVFAHMDTLGINHDSYLSESESVALLNGDQLGPERIIYYREMNARFAYHLSWRWNVGEEPHGIHPPEMNAILAHLNQIDVYNNPVGHHCSGKHQGRYRVYDPQLGNPDFHAAFAQINEDYHKEVLKYVKGSAASGYKWVVPLDEPNKILPKEDGKARLSFWKVVMAGGEGLDIYTAYTLKDYSDITVEDFRRLDSVWQQMAYGLQFFQRPEINRELPNMVTLDGLVSQGYCLANPGTIYVVYTQKSDGLTLDLTDVTGDFKVQWYDPARGGNFRTGSTEMVAGGGKVELGSAPSGSGEWVVLVTLIH